MPNIRIAEHAGTCYGVQRALDAARKAASDNQGPVQTLGPLIHNPIVVQELQSEGVGLADTLDEIEGGTVVIRAHGVVPETIERARAARLEVVDATCPYVKKVHLAAEKLVAEGYQLLVVGEYGHPEVEGILGHAGPTATVISDPSDLEGLELKPRVGIVVQTTQRAENLAAIASALAGRVKELRVVNTICKATAERQVAAAKIAGESDVMIVVGGKNSGNTRRLAEICTAACPATHHIETPAELESAWFSNAEAIGLTAGASTPQAHIDRAVERIRELAQQNSR